MTELGRGHKLGWAALGITVALLLAPAQVGAQSPPGQTPPIEPPPGGQPPAGQPPPTTPEQAPPPPAEQAPTPPPAPKVTYPTVMPTRDIKLTEHFAIRFGLQAQVWYEALQEQTETDGDQTYGYNFYCRRCRILAAVQPWDNITLSATIEAGNLGRNQATAFNKNFAPNFSVLDAFANVKFSEAVQLEFGLMIIPLNRNIVQGTTTYIGLDINNISAQAINALQTTVLRDVGLQIRGYLLDEKLDYRLGVYSGIRDAPVATGTPPVPVSPPNENAPLLSAYLQYNILDVDKGYVYNGCYYGRKSIAGVAAGFNFQKASAVGALDAPDPYIAFSAAAFVAYPIMGVNKAGADEVHGLVQYVHYDGGAEPGVFPTSPGATSTTLGTAPGIRNQNDFSAELGYYNKATKLSVFGGFEGRFIAEDADKAGVPSQLWFGGGVKYHLVDNLLNFTLAFKRSQFQDLPDGSPLKDFNQFVLAAQALYF